MSRQAAPGAAAPSASIASAAAQAAAARIEPPETFVAPSPTITGRVAPVVGHSTRELHSADLEITQPKALPPNLHPDDFEADVIVATDAVLNDGYAAELAFMEEMVTIVLYPKREKFAPRVYDFHVQGKGIRVFCDTPTLIPRKYLEVIARSQPYDVKTSYNKNEDKGEDAVCENFTHRHQSAAHPFTVVEDRNPRGPAWLMKVMRES
jgi:hypothetical protein